MGKFHITGDGTPGPCKATKRACPFGGENEHFSSLKEAQEYADKKLAQEYSVLPQNKGKIAEDLLEFYGETSLYDDIFEKFDNYDDLVEAMKSDLESPEWVQSVIDYIEETIEDNPNANFVSQGKKVITQLKPLT